MITFLQPGKCGEDCVRSVCAVLTYFSIVAVYGIPGIPGIPDIALNGISGIHGSRYNPLRLPLPDVGIAGTLYHPSHAA